MGKNNVYWFPKHILIKDFVETEFNHLTKNFYQVITSLRAFEDRNPAQAKHFS